ncbi:MAG: DUF4375 domain-containing protein [Gammaproteobacteria bacterium]|nr:DUF4375 domain-containing protein [Gammaproteobacteria bacterium]
MEDSYWRFVEPIWESVSIYDGGEIFLQEFHKATDKQKHLFAAHWAQSEIMNGGLGQFFSNSTGVLAPEAVVAFEVIGMPNCASILASAMNFFGDSYPRDRDTREIVFEKYWEQNGDDAIPIEEQEDLMAVEIEEENGGFEKAANNYANKG